MPRRTLVSGYKKLHILIMTRNHWFPTHTHTHTHTHTIDLIMTRFNTLPIHITLLLAIIISSSLAASAAPVEEGLSPSFYERSCPSVFQIVRDGVRSAVQSFVNVLSIYIHHICTPAAIYILIYYSPPYPALAPSHWAIYRPAKCCCHQFHIPPSGDVITRRCYHPIRQCHVRRSVASMCFTSTVCNTPNINKSNYCNSWMKLEVVAMAIETLNGQISGLQSTICGHRKWFINKNFISSWICFFFLHLFSDPLNSCIYFRKLRKA